MPIMRSIIFIAVLFVASDLNACFAGETPQNLDQALPLKPTRTVKFTVREGTWMSLDLSPDGQRIVFDLLGDLYILPITGGKATRVTRGMAFDGQPKYSPDGKQIVFTSDRSGVDDIWLMSTNGASLQRLTHNDGGGLYISPAWTPSGKALVVSKRTRGKTVPLQIDIATGSETEVQRPPEYLADDYLGPIVSPDGRYLFVAQRLGWKDPDGFGGYWNIVRIDRNQGSLHFETSPRLGGTGMRPALSHDGRYLVYGAMNRSHVGLILRDLESDEERWLLPEAQRPVSWWEANERDLLPGSAFSPDSKSFVTSYGGKIWRINLQTGQKDEIPFEADVDQQLGPPVRREFSLDDRSVSVRLVSDPALSPDAKRVAFSALDRIWIMTLPDGTPQRLTDGHAGEFHPSWSADGKSIAYATWDDNTGGAVYEAAATRSEKPRRLTRDDAYYSSVVYAPDGRHIAVVRGPKELHYYGAPGVSGAFDARRRHLSLDILLLSREGTIPVNLGPLDPEATATDAYSHGSLQFGSDGTLYVYRYHQGLFSVSADGKSKLKLKVTGYTSINNGWTQLPTDIIASPDGRQVLVKFWGQQVYLLTFDSRPLNAFPDGLEVSTETPPTGIRARRISDFGGDYVGWNARGDTGIIGLGASMFLVHAEDPEINRTLPRVDAHITLPADTPSDAELTVLRGARIITMRGDEVIDRGDILIRGSRILAVGNAGTLPTPPNAKVIDVSGKTITPGFLDVHCHINPPDNIHASIDWKLATMLAFGVTTIRDPHTGSPDLLTYADQISAGSALGPRVFTTLMPLRHYRPMHTLEDLRAYVRPYAEFYRTENIKNKLNRGRRAQQLLALAAQEAGLLVDNEGFDDAVIQLTYVLDGFVGLEHNYPTVPLYQDILELLAASGEYQTFTLTTQAGDAFYVRQFDNLRSFPPEMFHFYPPGALDTHIGDHWVGDYALDAAFFREIAQQPARLVAAGGHVGMGSHGDIPGIGYHFEMWAHGFGGMNNHDVLRAATIWSAEAIGHGKDLGSIEPGKLADLEILDANPLDDIHNTLKLKWIIKGGRFYKPFTLENATTETVGRRHH
jgi:Tol biopolymer transport system component